MGEKPGGMAREPDERDINGILDMGPRTFAPLGWIALGNREQVNGKRQISEAGAFVFSKQTIDDFPDVVDYYTNKSTGEIAPKRLEIMLAFDGLRDCFTTYYGLNFGGYIRCRGNGQIAVRSTCNQCNQMGCKHYDAKRTKTEIHCDKECPERKSGRCKPYGILTYRLHPVMDLGVWRTKTSSWNSIKDVEAGLIGIQKKFGHLAGLPMELRLVLTKVRDRTWKHTLKIGLIRNGHDGVSPFVAPVEADATLSDDGADDAAPDGAGEEQAESSPAFPAPARAAGDPPFDDGDASQPAPESARASDDLFPDPDVPFGAETPPASADDGSADLPADEGQVALIVRAFQSRKLGGQAVAGILETRYKVKVAKPLSKENLIEAIRALKHGAADELLSLYPAPPTLQQLMDEVQHVMQAMSEADLERVYDPALKRAGIAQGKLQDATNEQLKVLLADLKEK